MKKTLRILTFLFVFTFIFSINVFAETVDYQGASYEIITVGGETIAVLDSILDNFNTVVVPKEVSGHLVKDVSNQIDGSGVEDITFEYWSNIADKFDFTKFPNLEDIKIEQDTFAYGDPIGNFYTVSDDAIIRTYEHTRLYDKLQDMIYEEGAKSFVLDGNTYGEAPEFVYDDPIERNEIIGINRSGMNVLTIPAGSVQKFCPFTYNSTNLNGCDYFGMETVNSIDFYSMTPIEIYDLDKFKNLSNVSFFTDLGIGAMCQKYGFSYNEFDWGSPFYTGTLFGYEEIEGTNNIKITKYLPGQPGNDLRIPSEIDGKTVTCIGSEFNFDTGNNNRYIDIESVYIPVTVTTIEDGAFSHAYVHNFVFDGHSCDVTNWNSLIKFIHGIQIYDFNTNIYLNENTNIETDLRNNVTGNYTIKGFDDIQIEFEKPNQKILKGDTWSWIDEDYRIVPDLPIDSSLLTWSSDNENVVAYNTEYNYLTIKGAGKAKITLTYKNVQAEMNIEVLDGIGTNNIKMGSYSSEVQIIYYVYLGEPVEPHIYITDSNYNLLEEGKDYELVYSDNEAKGTGHVTINFLGDLKVCIKDGNDYIVQDSIVKDFYIIDPTDPMDEWGNIIGMFVVNPLEKKTYNYGETIVMTADGYNTEDGESFTVQFGNKQFTFNKESDGKYYARVLVDDSLYLDNANYPYTYYPMRYWVNNRVDQLDNGTWREVYGSYNADEIKFTLNPKPSQIVDVTKIETDENGMNLVVGETGTFHIRVFPENATNQNVTWSSSDPTIASVDNNGVVTAHKVGEVFITATSDDNENITVTNKVFVNAPVFTVSLHLNGGTLPGDLNIPVNGGSTLTEPHPEKTGYAIAGWYTDEGFNNQYTFDTPIIGNMDLYVKWEVELYNITYNLDGGTHPSPQNPLVYTIESDDITLGAPTKEGYEFVGWIESEGDEPALTITIPKGSTGNRFFTAVWSEIVPEEYVVQFMDGERELARQTIERGNYVEKPILAPKKDGYRLVDWYLDSELTTKFDFETTAITADTKIYAKYGKYTYSGETKQLEIGTIYYWGDEVVVPQNMSYYGDESDDYPGSSMRAGTYYLNYNTLNYHSGYRMWVIGSPGNLYFWFRRDASKPEPTGIKCISGEGGGPYKFELVYDPVPVSYTVTFETFGGGTIDSQTIINGKKATRPADPVLEGYTFVGWYTTPAFNEEFDFDTPINQDTIIYARFKIHIAELRFESTDLTVPALGKLTKNNDMNFERKVPENINIEMLNPVWIKQENGMTSDKFQVGHYNLSVRVNLHENAEYAIDSNTKLYINGIEYTVQPGSATFDHLIFFSPLYTVEDEPIIDYQIEVLNEGWHTQDTYNGKSAMRDNAGNLQQAMTIDIPNKPYEGSIEYRVHIENVGWMPWVKDGDVAGIEGTALRTEALQIRLTGEMAEHYDVYYRTHVQNNGWMSWAKNGEASGSSGAGLRIEGIQIQLVKKGDSEPSIFEYPSDKTYPFHEQVNAIYMGHIENYGDVGKDYKTRNGATLGFPNRKLRMEGITIISESTTPGTIEYTTHVQNVGWTDVVDGRWNTSGEYCGRKGLGLRVEGIKIRLTDELASKYSVYYRVKVEGQKEWQGWAKDGEEAGSMGYGKKLEAIQIKILVHGDPNEGNYKPNPSPMLKK